MSNKFGFIHRTNNSSWFCRDNNNTNNNNNNNNDNDNNNLRNIVIERHDFFYLNPISNVCFGYLQVFTTKNKCT